MNLMMKEQFAIISSKIKDNDMRYLPILLCAILFGGCTQSVSSWQKETLAKPQMQEGSQQTLLKSAKEQIFTSKEGSSGGNGAGGGGCGCK